MNRSGACRRASTFVAAGWLVLGRHSNIAGYKIALSEPLAPAGRPQVWPGKRLSGQRQVRSSVTRAPSGRTRARLWVEVEKRGQHLLNHQLIGL